MTDVLQRYGIKEVADVTFYHIDDATGKPDYPILVLDSLKVTSIEQTAETAEARGGKGNAKLIVWDFGKEITVNIEDALFSPQSFSIMLADGKVKKTLSGGTDTSEFYVRRSARAICTKNGVRPTVKIDNRSVNFEEVYQDKNATQKGVLFYKGNSADPAMDFVEGEAYFAVWYHPVASKSTITITPDSFPGTYYVTGDTMVRSERSGEDEYFQFIIPKAKMQAEQTISMEAEGDPSTFNMSLQVLRPESGEMIQFIQYSFADHTDASNKNDTLLNGTNEDGWVSDNETDAISDEKLVQVLFYDQEGEYLVGAIMKAATDPTSYTNWTIKNDATVYEDYKRSDGKTFVEVGLTESGSYTQPKTV